MSEGPERSKELFAKAAANAKDRYDYLCRLAKLYNDEK